MKRKKLKPLWKWWRGKCPPKWWHENLDLHAPFITIQVPPGDRIGKVKWMWALRFVSADPAVSSWYIAHNLAVDIGTARRMRARIIESTAGLPVPGVLQDLADLFSNYQRGRSVLRNPSYYSRLLKYGYL